MLGAFVIGFLSDGLVIIGVSAYWQTVFTGAVILGAVALACGFLLSRTAFGRWLYASGGNERAADLSGVPVKRVKISVYVLSGICAAMAGLVLSSQLTSGVLIAICRVPAFVATLGTMYVARGIALLMTNGLTYNKLSGSESLGNTGFDWLGFNRLFNIPVGVLVPIGMLLVILNGGIDLSVGSTLGLAGVMAGFMMQGISLEALGVVLYLPVWAVAILTLVVGALVGLVNQTLATSPAANASRSTKQLNLARLLLEGRAFIALLVIIATFSFLSPNYFSGANFLTMASHVAIFGLPGGWRWFIPPPRLVNVLASLTASW
ncbi:hypothetical protein CRX72_17505 [Pantoea sp. BRM17]|nr:hypothetical protein CRX72_17505 [Pantoea sp. BRM17]